MCTPLIFKFILTIGHKLLTASHSTVAPWSSRCRPYFSIDLFLYHRLDWFIPRIVSRLESLLVFVLFLNQLMPAETLCFKLGVILIKPWWARLPCALEKSIILSLGIRQRWATAWWSMFNDFIIFITTFRVWLTTEWTLLLTLAVEVCYIVILYTKLYKYNPSILLGNKIKNKNDK